MLPFSYVIDASQKMLQHYKETISIYTMHNISFFSPPVSLIVCFLGREKPVGWWKGKTLKFRHCIQYFFNQIWTFFSKRPVRGDKKTASLNSRHSKSWVSPCINNEEFIFWLQTHVFFNKNLNSHLENPIVGPKMAANQIKPLITPIHN